MISRRNIRVKVMQTLYAVESLDRSAPGEEPVKLLRRQFDNSRQLLLFLIRSLTEVALYAETDARNRAAKHLPSALDLNVNTRIAGNELLRKILDHTSYCQAVKEEKTALLDNPGLIRKLYLEMIRQDAYIHYAGLEMRDPKSEKEILEFILNEILLPSEAFTAYAEELFNNWDDDAEMMQILISNFLQKPAGFSFQELLGNEKWQFARSLLQTTLERKEIALEYIKPRLKNWEPERIAVLDMLLMRMGVCEFLYFETIPPKVTINEYIDLAKEYSTPQSGHFVNGILDNIHKDLVREEKMHKISFKPSR